MSVSEEDLVKRLADIKAYLERRVGETEEEAARLRSFLEVVDALLAERSFKKPGVSGFVSEQRQEPALAARRLTRPIEIITVASSDGVHLADIRVEDGRLRVIPDANLRFDPNSPPLRAFLIGRVLEPMQARDREASRTGELAQDKVLSYEVRQENNVLKEICVENYGDERRLIELRNAVKWTLRRMYERTLSRG